MDHQIAAGSCQQYNLKSEYNRKSRHHPGVIKVITATVTYAWRTKDAAVPFPQESITGINKTVRDGHITVTLLAPFKLLEQLEIAWNNYCFSC